MQVHSAVYSMLSQACNILFKTNLLSTNNAILAENLIINLTDLDF